MFDIAGFVRSARTLTVGVFRKKESLKQEIAEMSLVHCIAYGWFCLFFATLTSAMYQYFFSAQVLGQLNPASPQFLETSKALQSIMSLPLEEFIERLEIVRVSSFASILMSPLSSWFFIYLLAGALFFFSKLVSFNSNTQDAYERMIKIVSVGQAPLFLCIIPAIGPFVGNLWSMWYIAKGIGDLFQINLFTRASIVIFCSLVLFSVWNSTLTTLAVAYRNKESSLTAKNLSRIESSEFLGDMI
jgi:hypothetical protein